MSAKQFARIANGVTRFGLTLPATRNLAIVLPPLIEQRAIAAVLDSIDEAIERTDEVIAATERLRDALLHELLTRGLPGRHTEFKLDPGIGPIPASWTVVRLANMATLVTSGSRGWSRYFRSNGALFVRSQNILGGKIDRSDSIFVEPPDDAEAVRTLICKGDLLVSITGEPGKVAVADDALGAAFVSQHVGLVRLTDTALSRFVVEFLQGPAGRAQFRRVSYSQTRPGLNLIDIQNMRIALPPSSERDAISLTGMSLRESIETNRSGRNRLRSLQAAIADALLTGRIRANFPTGGDA